jgi:hypothetical protein
MGGAGGVSHASQLLGHPADRAEIEHEPVDASAIVAAQVQVHRRERGDRARRPDQLHWRPSPGQGDSSHAVADRGAHVPDHAFEDRGVGFRSERLREGDHADRQ